MRKIKLRGRYGKDKYILVDNEDFELVNKYKWYLSRKNDYVQKTHPLIGIGRFLLNPPKDLVVDHINRNPLDNRRSNLRIVTVLENLKNRSIQQNNKSGYAGIHWDKLRKKWKAYYYKDSRSIWLGRFKNKKDALRAYNIKSGDYLVSSLG